jgi:uncharacterized protein (DUF1800 family)
LDRIVARDARHSLFAAAAIAFVAACTTGPGIPPAPGESVRAADVHADVQLLNRVTWGANPSSARAMTQAGSSQWLERQLHPAPQETLPPEVRAQIDGMTITQRPVTELAVELEKRRREFQNTSDDMQKKSAQQSYQEELARLGREASARMLLRALYSPDQLREQMTWFWLNHFSVHQFKANLRVLIADYEEHAIRPHALGRFRDLLGAVAHHPAMLIYLDNAQNAVNRINENYARELMELHTLGVDGGYTQRDVQQLARVLTGFGVNIAGEARNIRPAMRDQYMHEGLFEFIPGRHDYGDKTLLGATIKGRGASELDEALDRLAGHPSTARFISRKLAIYFVSDDPPPGLIERMARSFQSSDGDIATVLGTLFASEEFRNSLGTKFKDPVHFVVSAVRLAYDDKPILNANPMIGWLFRMGEPLYGRATPDGYPMIRGEWASPGQLATRFEIARAIGYGSAGLFRSDGAKPLERAAFPQLANALYFESMQRTLSDTTRITLDKAASPQEWNMLLLASPEFMNR